MPKYKIQTSHHFFFFLLYSSHLHVDTHTPKSAILYVPLSHINPTVPFLNFSKQLFHKLVWLWKGEVQKEQVGRKGKISETDNGLNEHYRSWTLRLGIHKFLRNLEKQEFIER